MYYFNLSSLIFFCLFSGGTYISFGITSSVYISVTDLLGGFCDASLRVLCDI